LEQAIPPNTRLIPPHRYDFYTIAWVTNGRGTHTVDFVNYYLEPQTLFFTSPGQIYSCVPSHQPAGYVAHFSAEFLLVNSEGTNLLAEFPFFHLLTGVPFVQLHDLDRPRIQELFGHLEHEANSAAFRNDDMIRLYLRALLIHIQRIAGADGMAQPRRASTRLVKQFQMLLEERFLQTMLLTDYAQQLGVTAKHLSETVKQETGKTASRLIQDRVILEAKRLLKYSNLTVTAIALHLGFEDSAYFGASFGDTPSNRQARFGQHTRK
jgi:AraC family transcriptional regulator, transcriptional activator of pobA